MQLDLTLSSQETLGPDAEPRLDAVVGVPIGWADEAEVQIAYAIGVAEPVSVLVETFGTAKVDEARIARAVRATFPLTPRGMIEALDLRQPLYRKTAAYGHFGREDEGFTWETLDRLEQLKSRV